MSGARQIIPTWPPREWHKGRALQLRENAASSAVAGKILRHNVVELAEIVLAWYERLSDINWLLETAATQGETGERCEHCGTPKVMIQSMEDLQRAKGGGE